MNLLSLCLDPRSSFHHGPRDGLRQRCCRIVLMNNILLWGLMPACIQNAKIAKLYLYNNEHALALSHHSMCMRKFGDFSRAALVRRRSSTGAGWPDSKSCTPRSTRRNNPPCPRHRVFAELLEQGSRSTLQISQYKSPALTSNASSATAAVRGSSAPSVDMNALRSLGLNPSHSLQHPGFYYYMASRCTELRREKFQVAIDAEVCLWPLYHDHF